MQNKRLAGILVIAVVGMFAFSFALIPLYTVLCKAWGINGKVDDQVAPSSLQVDKKRNITVEFLATTNENLPWDFYSLTKKIVIHPGENVLIDYFAKNNSAVTMTVQAIPSVSPGIAAKYLKKTECFCFTQQTFKAREERKMPVLFHLDVDLPKEIHTVTLSYTLFDTANLGHIKPKQTPGRIP